MNKIEDDKNVFCLFGGGVVPHPPIPQILVKKAKDITENSIRITTKKEITCQQKL